MSDMQIAVGLRRETGVDGIVYALCQILLSMACSIKFLLVASFSITLPRFCLYFHSYEYHI